VYKPTRQKHKICSFDVSQTKGGQILLQRIKFRLKLTPQAFRNTKTNNWKLKISSSADCLRVLNFFSKVAPVKLRGSKRVAYVEWVKQMR
jgi:hypothetical protein